MCTLNHWNHKGINLALVMDHLLRDRGVFRNDTHQHTSYGVTFPPHWNESALEIPLNG